MTIRATIAGTGGEAIDLILERKYKNIYQVIGVDPTRMHPMLGTTMLYVSGSLFYPVMTKQGMKPAKITPTKLREVTIDGLEIGPAVMHGPKGPNGTADQDNKPPIKTIAKK